MRTLIPFLLFLMFANASAEIVQVNDSTSTTIPLTPTPGHHKGTVAPVIVRQDDRSLTFPSWCASFTVCLADEDADIVFTGYNNIYEGFYSYRGYNNPFSLWNR